MKDFLICFYLLDYCYFKIYEDDLGGILGAMSPDLMADGLPRDMAYLEYWKRTAPESPSSDEEYIQKADAFLAYYQTNFGFSLEKTRDLLKTPEILAYVGTARSKAEETCGKHHYPADLSDNSLKSQIEELLHLAETLKNEREFSFYPPASESEIQKLENHLQISLPEDYKNFLRFSNGARLNHFTAELYSVSEIISFSDMKKADWFPADYVMLADIIGDGEVLCFSKETGKFIRCFDGEEEKFETFTDFLENMIDFIKEITE